VLRVGCFEGLQSLDLAVTGMTGAACVQRVRQALAGDDNKD